jgi:hypothetical protein
MSDAKTYFWCDRYPFGNAGGIGWLTVKLEQGQRQGTHCEVVGVRTVVFSQSSIFFFLTTRHEVRHDKQNFARLPSDLKFGNEGGLTQYQLRKARYVSYVAIEKLPVIIL